jgi:hypothetical protein
MKGGHRKKKGVGVNVIESDVTKKNVVIGIWSVVVGMKKTASRKCVKNFVESVRKSKGKRPN